MATTTYDAGNRLTQWGTSTLSYDFNGNLTNDGTKTYTWNVRDQLLSMTGASFQYDAQGRRHRRAVGSTTRDFVYDGLNLVQEKQNTTVKANVLTGLGLDELFTRIFPGVVFRQVPSTVVAMAFGAMALLALLSWRASTNNPLSLLGSGLVARPRTALALELIYTGRDASGPSGRL